VDFANAEESWQVFTMLESFTDGMGAWRFEDILGKPLLKLPDWLVSDLMTWRYLTGIIKSMKEPDTQDD
jgi:hypothetical protein